MKKGTFSKIFVSILFVLTIMFTCAVLYLNYTDHDVDSALIYSAFAFLTSEALAMAGIKCSKNKYDTVVDENFGSSGVNTSNRSNQTDSTDDDEDVISDDSTETDDDSQSNDSSDLEDESLSSDDDSVLKSISDPVG